MTWKWAYITMGFTLLAEIGSAKERADIIVDKHGSGQFTSIQQALNSIERETTPVMILIRNGEYIEKLFITRSHLTLVGEHRDSTQIVYAELRTNWTKARNDRPDGTAEDLDWGAGVINIGKGAADITIANLTVHNNYGSLHGNHDHQFTIRGFDATRLMLLSCNVVSDGGDALALWNRESGMYYHNDCYFEGWVDYVCPRGWCYITDSKFYGHNMSASIWHDGSANRGQKFVIRNSFFDGVPNFPLGRHHRDAQFFLIGCTFSENMADRPIYAPNSPNLVPRVWGERHYFSNCTREGGNYGWFADNLDAADGSPKPEDISARWTFDGMWDPEENMPAVLPFAFLPKPEQSTKDVPTRNLQLSWVAGRNATSHNIYFGDNDEPAFKANQKQTRLDPGPLKPNTTYTWRVDVVTEDEIVKGRLWSFTTGETIRQ
jgi:pectinesterase